MIQSNNTQRLDWKRIAGFGAELGIAVTFLYALGFIVYAITRATIDLLVTPQIDAGWFGTTIATCIALAVPAFLLAALFAPITTLIGALTALVVNVAWRAFNSNQNSRQAISIGFVVAGTFVGAMLALLIFGVGLRWQPAIAETLIFWLGLPLLLYIIAGGVGGWFLNQLKLSEIGAK